MLAEAIDNFVASARDPSIKLRNPFSGLDYTVQQPPQPSPFDTLVRKSDTEHELRYKVWKAFKDAGRIAAYRVTNPLYAPCTSDIRLDHENGTQLLVEMKLGAVIVEHKPSGRVVFKHLYRSMGISRGVFNFKAPWDYLLTLVDSDNGYLICKDDISQEVWHRIPADGGLYVSHEFPDDTFVNRHRVHLGDAFSLVTTVQRIL